MMWSLTSLVLAAALRILRKCAKFAGVSALASLVFTLALPHASSALRAADPIVSAALRITQGPVTRAAPARQREIVISLGPDARAKLDERFLSVAVDSSLLVGGHWWSPEAEVEPGIGRRRIQPLDFSSPRLRELTSALAPAYLRIGGTEADRIYYAVEEPSPKAPPAYELVLTASQWDGVTAFARQTGLDLFFTLNAGPSSRDEEGRWQPDNAERLLRHARSRNDRIAVLELGNEINAYWFGYGPRQQPDGATIAADGVRLRTLAQEYFPQALIVGPGEFFWPRVGSPFASKTHVLDGLLEADGARAFDALTWHYYPQQSRRCPIATRRASPRALLEPAFLDEVSRWAHDFETKRDAHAPGLPVWLGETGNAQCGGEPLVSDRFVSSLWWMDELGLLAARGQPIVVRQSLVGSNYGLLDDTSFEPRPDYFASVLFKRLMGSLALTVVREGDSDPFVRVYAQCTPERTGKKSGSATLLAVNLHEAEHAAVRWSKAAQTEAEIYEVTAPALTSSQAFLNGGAMLAPPGLDLSLSPRRQTFSGVLDLPPASYTFMVVASDVPACM